MYTTAYLLNILANRTKASAFGALNFGTHRYLTIVNSTGFEMHYEIELL